MTGLDDMNDNRDRIGEVADCLLRIEMELRRLDEWRSEPPPASAFHSSQPFCLDTLAFTEWVQFVFIRRMKVLIEDDHPLPSVSGMAPMAEEHFRKEARSGHGLIRALEEMDRLLSGS